VSTDTPSGAAPVAPTALEALLALQDADSAVDRLRHRRARLAARTVLAELEARLAGKAAEAAAIDEARRAHEARLAELASEVEELVSRTARLDDHLRAGEAASFRDEEALAAEMGSLGNRRGELDDEQLVVMEAIEELEGELSRLASERSAIGSEIASVRLAIGAAETEIDTEIATIAIGRADAAARVPDGLLDEYERLRDRLDGVGVARLVNGSCDGCHLAVSASELDHLRHAGPDEIVRCAQCGRILVAGR